MFGQVLTGLAGPWLAAGLVAATALVAWLHMRRPRRRRVLVSFEELWAGLPGAARSRGWSARIRQIAPLLLQLAVVWALLFAAADPRRAPRPQDGQAIAILVDCSASMAASGAGPGRGTRLDLARERVRAIVEGLGVDDRAAITCFAGRPRPLTDLTGDRGRLAQALDELRVEPEAGVAGPAVTHAHTLVAGQPRARVIVVSDQPALRAELGGAELLLVGEPAENVAIAGLTAQPATAPGSFRIEVTVRRFGRARPVQSVQPVKVSLREGGRTLATLTGEVPVGERRILTATVTGTGTVSAHLEQPVRGPANALGLDDHATIPLPRPRPRRVLAVGARNLYLEGALLGLAPAVTVDRLDPGVPLPARAAEYDVIVFDSTTPAAPPTAGRYLFLDPAGPGSPFPARGTVRDPVATEIERDHPLLAHVSLADLNVARARRLLPGPDDQVVAAALGTPLLIARQRPALRVVALAFDPRRSDLPLRPAFPLLLANALDWLTAGSAAAPAPLSTGLVDRRESDTTVTGQRAAVNAAAPARVRSPRTVAPWLLALAALLAVAEWGLFGRRLPRRAAARLGLLSGRGLFLAAVAAAIAAVVWTLPGRPVVPALAPVVDVSASVDDLALKQATDLLAAISPGNGQRFDAGDGPARGWRFAEIPAPLAATGKQSLARFAGAAGWQSDLGLALATGLAALDSRRPGRLLLLSDGVATQGALEPVVQALVNRGVSVWVSPLAGRTAPAAAVTGLRPVGELRPGASFVLEAGLRAARPGEVRLRLTRDGQALERIPEQAITLKPGTSSQRFVVPVPPERSVYRVQIAGAGIQPPSDSALLAVAGARRPRVLILAEQRGAGAAFTRALAAEQIETVVAAPGSAPAAPASWLAEHELVVLADVPAARLSPALARALRGYVHDQGGGLLVSGDPAGWGGGGYEKTALGPLLPLEHDPGERKQEATLALALVIDRSGSMSGPKMELTKQAARGAAQLLQPPDLIAVITFDSQAQTAVRLQPAANRQRVAAGIAAIRSGGGTNVLPGLREGLDQLLNATARRKHVIVLSDGQSPADGVIELVDEAASAHITVSAVGVGDAADLTLLQNIAHRGGGRFHHARDPSTVPRIFTRETAELTASPARESPTRARLVKPTQALANIPFASAPALAGHARAKVRPGAEVLLATQDGEPLLARWQQGLGQVLVWTGNLGGRWAASWTRWREYPRLWGQLARSVMSRRGARELPLELRRAGDEVIAQVRASDPAGRPLTGLSGELHLAAVTAAGQLGPLQAAAPLAERAAGLYEARVQVGQAAALLAEARLEDPAEQAGPAFQAQGALSLPLAPDLTPPDGEALAGTTVLESIARRTGGQLIRSGQERQTPRKLASLRAPAPSPTPEQIPLRPPLALAALALFLADVASRRANFRAPGPATAQG